MNCVKCDKALPDGASWCCWCGAKQERATAHKKRGNGQGTVVKLPTGRYKAIVVTGYYTDASGKLKRHTRSKTFERKKDAVAALPSLLADPGQKPKKAITFAELYDIWLPTHRAGRSTINCYKAAYKHFDAISGMRMADIDVDDLQECIDACPHGRRTKENMRALVGLMYKYGVPRHAIPDGLNLAPYLVIDGDPAAKRDSFTDSEIAAIKNACGIVPHAIDVYCLIYTGFRPREFLALTAGSYDPDRGCLIGGGKTKAGTDRTVTVSPKIRQFIEQAAAAGGYLFPNDKGGQFGLKEFSEAFYTVLQATGIDNPVIGEGTKKRHRLTPHSCRHTFATLLKRVPGAVTDKQALIGHASAEMLMYYEDSTLEDKRKITDLI